MMTKHAIHVTDAPIRLDRDGQALTDARIVCGGATIGRVLFTEPPTAIEISAKHCRVERCWIVGGGVSVEA